MLFGIVCDNMISKSYTYNTYSMCALWNRRGIARECAMTNRNLLFEQLWWWWARECALKKKSVHRAYAIIAHWSKKQTNQCAAAYLIAWTAYIVIIARVGFIIYMPHEYVWGVIPIWIDEDESENDVDGCGFVFVRQLHHIKRIMILNLQWYVNCI